MSAPFALLILLGLPALWWLHRRARPQGDVPFSAFFLVREQAGEGRSGRRLRAPFLLGLRILALSLLALAAVGPTPPTRGGTLALTVGPVTPDPNWTAPVTYVRAGTPPTQAPDPTGIIRVAAPPAWGAALLLGRRLAPDAQVVLPASAPSTQAVVGGGAVALDDGRVRITATVIGSLAPVLHLGDARHPLEAGAGEFAIEMVAPAGPATLVVEGAPPWPICIPDAGPIAIADAGWPPAVERVLAILPGVTRTPAESANWHPASGTVANAGWAPFGPLRTAFDFGVGPPDGSPAPLWFAADLPPPGAVARRWHALPNLAEPILFAGDAPVVDVGQGAAGHRVRFGFQPVDSDLPQTAGWPILFDALLTRTRVAASRCRAHRAGDRLVLRSGTAVTAHGQTYDGVDGQVAIDGLDTQGLVELNSGGERAWLAVVPGIRTAPPAFVDLQAPAPAPKPGRMPWILAALALWLASIGVSRRWTAPLAWVVAVVIALPLVLPNFGPPGAVAIAVDTSRSVPDGALQTALDAVRTVLPKAQRVDGDSDVTGVGMGPLRRKTDGTRHGPLLNAARDLAGEGGVVVLLSDGRATDGPVPLDVPVVAVAVRAAAPDAQVIFAHATRLGDQVFLRATFSASAPVAAIVRLGEVEVPVALSQTPRTVQAVLPADEAEIEVRVIAEGDPMPANDVRPVAVAGETPRQGLAVGAGAVGWLEAAGLSARELTAAGLAEAGRQLGLMRAMAIHDQPADAFAPDVLVGLTRWVAAGGVLVLAGRDDAFGPGGWGGTALDTLSPLASDPRPPKARRLAVSLALDRSGSMAEEAGGIGPKAAGRLGAAIAAGLADDDHLGVLAFGMQAEPLLAPTPIARLRADGIRTPTLARGGTALLPMARAGIAQLAVAEAPRKVLVVLTDGHLTDADQADAAIAMLRAKGVRMVAILTGEDPAMQPLQRIAQATGGVAIRADRAAISRRALAGVLAVGTDGLFARGGPAQASGAWAARVGGAPPPVGRRVRVRARKNARVLATVDGDPLLAEWAIGQGRVIALAADRWDLAADQWAALLSPAAAARPAEASIRVENGLLVYAADPRDPPPAGAAIIEGASRAAVAWRSVGPGRAIAPLPPGPVEVLTVTSPTANGAVIARVTRPPSAEIQRTGLDLGALTLQARLTGGRVVAPDQVAAAVADLQGRQKTDPFTPWLLAFAALLAILEVAGWAGSGPSVFFPMLSRHRS